MRHGRAKAARKTLSFFSRQGIHPPYVVLLDGTFLLASVLQKVPLLERLDRILQHHTYNVKVTRSCLDELYTLAESSKRIIPSSSSSEKKKQQEEALQQARQWGLDECQILEHSDIPKQDEMKMDEQQSSSADVGSVAGQDIVKLVSCNNKVSYLVATQDETLLDLLRNKGKCPLLRLSRGVLLLENPSKACLRRANYQERNKYSALTQERSLAQSVKEEEREQQRQQARNVPTLRVKKKAKGPNPLSCKRKRTPDIIEPRKRKRTRKGNKAGEAAAST